MHQKHALSRKLALGLALALIILTTTLPASAATTLLSNLGNPAPFNVTNIDDVSRKAVIFQMPATGYDLESIIMTLQLNKASPAHLRLAIYDVNGSNNPATELFGWDVDAATTSSCSDFTFTPPAKKQLAAGKTYALVLSGRDATNGANWCVSTAASTPTGAATFIAYRFYFGSWLNSSTYNRFELVGNAPATTVTLDGFHAAPASPWQALTRWLSGLFK